MKFLGVRLWVLGLILIVIGITLLLTPKKPDPWTTLPYPQPKYEEPSLIERTTP